MVDKIHWYNGKRLKVSYDSGRCIHAAECVKGLPKVFDPERKPWIDPDAATSAEVIEVIGRCPSGALKYENENESEEAGMSENENTITLVTNGPLYCEGELEFQDADGAVLDKAADMALCRCGASKNKPYCDGSHKEYGFEHDGSIRDARADDDVDASVDTLVFSLRSNGPLMFKGPVRITSDKGETQRNKGALCRCGASKNKPFCDGSHKGIDFQAD